MFKPIITPNHTAVMFAEGSANKMGATIGTTTTAISMKSRKKPRIKITNITMANCAQKPPGKLLRNSFTISSPPKARNAEVSIAAPSKMINTKAVVFDVSNITSFKISSTFSTRKKLQPIPTSKPAVPNNPIYIPKKSSAVEAALMFMSKLDIATPRIISDATTIIAGVYLPEFSGIVL